MTDIATRLRDRAYASKVPDPLSEEAADTIDRLNREVSVLIAECQKQKDLIVNGGGELGLREGRAATLNPCSHGSGTTCSVPAGRASGPG